MNEKPSRCRPVIIGSFLPASLACIRSWGRRGCTPGMVCYRHPHEMRPVSRYLAEHLSIPRSEVHTEGGYRKILDFLEAFKATDITCLEDGVALWLSRHRDELAARCTPWFPGTDALEEGLSKSRQIEAALRVEMEVLPSYYLSKGERHPVRRVDFPLCLRPSGHKSVRPPFKTIVVDDQDQLDSFMEGLEVLEKPLIGQPFRDLPNLVVHGVRSPDGASFGLRAFLVERKLLAMSLTMRPWDLSPILEKKCRAFTEEMGLTGNYHFEFLYHRSRERAWFLEINNRFGGTTGKVLALGYDEPGMALDAFHGGGERPIRLRNRVVSNNHSLLEYILFALRKRLGRVDGPVESRPASIARALFLMAAARDEIFSPDDLPGTLAMYRGNVRSFFQ